MVFIVEDGSARPDANSLVSLERATAYLAGTGYAQSWENDDEDRQRELLVSATTLISSSFNFRGYLVSETQSLPFPRRELRDREGRLIIGVPNLVQNAVAELAFTLREAGNYMQDSELATLESIKVGPISLEISDLASQTKIIPDSVIRFLSEYGTYRFGKNRMRRLIAG